ncbi:MAG: type II toxin-antitoxin system RelE/ParE family toxin, partial [Chloroflexi bacterium]|nr:type II toxin-antitoxin system RelE/ParE family toxin [Chloroflexota bacterium]
MARIRIRFHPDAAAEIEAALHWYAERSLVAAQAFSAEVIICVERVGENPERWPRFPQGTRRYLFPHFPFSIVFRIHREEIEIV